LEIVSKARGRLQMLRPKDLWCAVLPRK